MKRPSVLDDLDCREPWRLDAACRGKGNRIFFSNSKEDKERAGAMCASCPVPHHCLVFAMVNEPKDLVSRNGIWAGTTASDRHRMATAHQQRST